MKRSIWVVGHSGPRVSLGLAVAVSLTFVFTSAALRAAEDSPPAAQAQQEKPASEDPAAKGGFDPFNVPNVMGEELRGYFEKLSAWQPAFDPAARRDKELQMKLRDEYLRSRKNLVAVADKLLAEKPEEAVRIQVTQAKWMSLRLLSNFEDSYTAPYEKLTQELMTDSNPELAQMAQRMHLMNRISGLVEETSKESPQQVYADVMKLANASKEVNPETLGLLDNTAYIMEMIGQYPLATEIHNWVIKAAQQQPSPQLEQAKGQSEKALKRIGLIGQPLDLKGHLLDGSEIDLSNYKGKVVLVDFWATWCGPCIAELPNVQENYKKYHDEGFEVIGISLDETVEPLVEFIKEKNLPWSQIFSKDESTRGFSDPRVDQFGVNGIPATFLVGKDGKIVHVNVRGHRLGKLLEEMLGPQK
ncbi:MAG: TlpA disulfide reductase family protein [Pirellulales bacterium]|nr:TlpA disulfide reductase family protein [Pirellulales bacterium]